METLLKFQKMALVLVKNDALDKLLLIAYLETKKYSELNNTKPNGDWNVGVKNINSEDLVDDLVNAENKSSRYKAITFLLKDYKVKIGGYRFHSSINHREVTLQKIKFFLFDELLLDFDYLITSNPNGNDDYQFVNIEEFHKDDRSKIVLENIYKLILEKENNEEVTTINDTRKIARSKFSF